MEVKRFCKQIKPNVPKYLEIPRPFFCESMAEFVVLVSANRRKWKLNVEKSLTGDRYILWSSFVSKCGISNGDIVLFKHLHTNHMEIEVYSPSGVLKNGHHRQQQVAADISSESSESSGSSEDFMKEEILHCRTRKLQRPKRLSSSSSSESAGRKRLRPSMEMCASSRLLPLFNRASGRLHWVRNCKPEHLAQGTEAAFARATAFQRESLKNPSLLMVLPGYANVVYFPKAFTDEYCPWGHEHIELNDEMRESWILIWQNSKIISGFQKFVAARNLHKGDVCVFEVKKKGFLVYTFRENECKLKGKAAMMEQQENQKKQHVLNESVKLEEHPDPLFRNSRSSGSRGRNNSDYYEEKMNEPHEDHAHVGTTDADAPAPVMGDDMQLQISFHKDAAGVLRPQLSAVMPLEQSQLSQILGPSVLKDLLAAALKRKAE